MQSYRELDIYKSAHRLALSVHKMTMTLPKYETYEEGSQIRRSSKSVAANIVEGYSHKRYQAEFLRYLIHAHGSCNETIEHLELLQETEALNGDAIDKNLKTDYERLGAMINKMIQAVAKNSASKG